MKPHVSSTQLPSRCWPLRRPATLLALVLGLCGSTAGAGVADGLLSYWPLDVANSGTTPDAGFTNTMTIVGSPTISAGQVGNAFTLNGSSTYLTNLHDFDRIATGLPLYGAGSLTVSMWVKGGAQTAKYLFSEGNTTNGNPIFIIQTGNAAANNAKLDVVLRTTGGTVLINHIASTNVVFNNAWHHVAVVDNRGSVKVYIDGVPDPANYSYNYVEGGLLLNTTAIGTLVRAAVATGNIFNGQIDDVAVWERALSPDEVNQVRTNGIPLPVTPHAPVLANVPADAVKHQGDWHLLSVNAYGSRPFVNRYQWSRNGASIADATNRTYLVANLQTNNSGDYYSVTVTNELGSSSSPNATLTVLADPAPGLTNGLVDYWPLDAATPLDTNLLSRELHFGHDMVLVNVDVSTQLVSGRYSNAVSFVNTLPSYGVRSNGSPIYANTNYSVALWVKGSYVGQSDRRVFSEGSSANNNPLFTLGTDNTGTTPSATPFVRNDAGVNAAIVGRKSTRPVFDDAWHHLVWTDASGQGKLYVDGVLDETDYTYTRPALTLNLTMIGVTARAPAPVTPFTGLIDEVATWNRVLTWTEIQELVTNGVPIPEGVVAPSFTTQPPERTNDVYVGDTVAFPTVVSGTLPIAYQWRKSGTPIPEALVPSAITDTLILPNVQLADSGGVFSLVASNGAGSVTSSIVHLTVATYSPATNGEVLKVDLGLTSSPNPQPGFGEMSLGSNPATLGVVKVTLSGIGASLAERLRATPVDAGTALTQSRIYQDFVFANSTADGTGMRVLVERLAPNVQYGVTLWSFDSVSTGARYADWSETSSGVPVVIQSSYSFDGATLPTADFDNTLGALLTSSATGKLQFDGVKNGGTSFGVFLNAIRLVANPVVRITHAQLVNGVLRLTAEGKYPGQPMLFEETTDLTGGVWSPPSTGGIVEMHGPVVIGEFTIGTTPTFYRAVGY